MNIYDISSWLFGSEPVPLSKISQDKLLQNIKFKIEKIDINMAQINKNIESLTSQNEINIDAIELSIMCGLVISEHKNSTDFKKISGNCIDLMDNLCLSINEKLNSEYLKLLQFKSKKDSLERILSNLTKIFETK